MGVKMNYLFPERFQELLDNSLLKEDKLLEASLDIPFALKFANALHKEGIKVNKEVTIEGMVEQLCQLHVKS